MMQGKCPLCEGKLENKYGDVTFVVRRRQVVVHNVDYSQCNKCKEKFFASGVQKYIETAVYKRKRAKVA